MAAVSQGRIAPSDSRQDRLLTSPTERLVSELNFAWSPNVKGVF